VNVANVDAKAARLAKDFVTVAAGQAVHRRSGVRQLMVAIVVLGAYKKKKNLGTLSGANIIARSYEGAGMAALYVVMTVFVTRTSTGELVTKTI
jgi:hypothetical protein